METQPIPRTTASMNLTGLEESKSQEDIVSGRHKPYKYKKLD